MKLLGIAFFAAAVAVAAFAVTHAVATVPKPEFALGFKALADQIPDIVGEPLEDEHHDPINGDGLHKTTSSKAATQYGLQ